MSPLAPDNLLIKAGLLTPGSKVASGMASAAPDIQQPSSADTGWVPLPPNLLQKAQVGRFSVGGPAARMAMFPDEFKGSGEDKPNIVMRGIMGITAGIADMAPSTMALAAGVIDFLGADEAGAALGQQALDVSSWLNDHLAVENPTLYDHAMRGVGSMLTFILPGLGAAGIGTKAAIKLGMVARTAAGVAQTTAEGAAILSKGGQAFRALTGGGAMSFLEAAVEQSQREMELIGKGMTPEQAMKESAPVFWYNMGVLTATNTVGYFMPLPIKTKNEFVRRAAKAVEAAFTEGGQERAQAVIQDVASGTGEWGDFLNPQKYGTETAVGAIVGGGTAALLPGEEDTPQNAPGAPVANAPAPPSQKPPTPPTPQQAPAQAAQPATPPLPPAAPAAPIPEPVAPPPPPANLPMQPAEDFDVWTGEDDFSDVDEEGARGPMPPPPAEEQPLQPTPAEREKPEWAWKPEPPAETAAKPVNAQAEAIEVWSPVNTMPRELKQRLRAVEGVANAGKFVDKASIEAGSKTYRLPTAGNHLLHVGPTRFVYAHTVDGKKYVQEGKVTPELLADLEALYVKPSESPISPAAPAPLRKVASEAKRRAAERKAREQAEVAAVNAEAQRRMDEASNVKNTTTDTEAKQEEPAAPAPAAASGIVSMPTSALTVSKPGEFQKRENVDNEESQTNEAKMQAIMADFRPERLTPIVAWRDPVDGKLKVLDGHHTLEAAKRAGITNVNVREFKGTREEATREAEILNDLRTANDPLSRASTVRRRRSAGMSEAEIEAEARTIYQEGTATVLQLSFLNPNGQLVAAIKQFMGTDQDSDTTGNLMKITKWIGEARRRNPNLTDAHEGEMFDVLRREMARDNKPAWASKNETFLKHVRGIVSAPSFDASGAINLYQDKRTQSEREYDAELQAAEDKVVAAEAAIQEVTDELDGLFPVLDEKGNPKHHKSGKLKGRVMKALVPGKAVTDEDARARRLAPVKYALELAKQDLGAVIATKESYAARDRDQGGLFRVGRGNGWAAVMSAYGEWRILGYFPTKAAAVQAVEREQGKSMASQRRGGYYELDGRHIVARSEDLAAMGYETKDSGGSFRLGRPDINKLNKAAAAKGLSPAVTAKPRDLMDEMVMRVARMFGFKNVQFVTGLTNKYGQMAHGYYQPESDTVFLNIDSKEPMLTVLMHEVAHRMEMEHPDLYGQLIQILNDPANVRRGGKEVYAKDAKARGYAEVGVEREWVADGLMEAAARPEFWNVIQEKNPTLAGKLVQMIVDAMNAIRKMFAASGASVDIYYTNFGPLVRQIANVAAQMQAREAAAVTRETTAQIEMFRIAPIGNKFADEMRNKQDAAMKANNQHRHQGWSAGWRHVYMLMVDKHTFTYAMIRDIVKAANPKLAENFSLVRNPYIALRRFGSWMSAVEVALKHGVYSWDGKTVLAPGLEQVIRKHGLADAIDSREFGMFYTAATLVSRKYSLASRGKDFFGDDPTSDEYQAAEDEFLKWQNIYDDYGGAQSKWMPAVDDFTSYAYALIRRSYEAGVINESEFDNLTKTYSVYAPLFVIDSSRYNVDRGDPVGAGTAAHEMTRFDPTAVRMDPIDALIKQTYHLEFFTRRNEAARKHADFIRMFRDKSMKGVTVLPGFGMRVKPKTDPVAKRVKELLEAAGMSEAEIAALGRTPEQLEREAKLYVTSRIQPDGVIALLRNDNVEYWQLEPDIYESFMAATGPKASHTMMRFFSAQTSLLRAGAVLTPDFMARNQFRDFASSAIISQHLIRNPVDPFLVPVRILRGLSAAIGNTEKFKEFILEVGHAQLHAQDQTGLRKSSEQATRNARGRFNYVLHSSPITILQEFGKLTENSTRYAVYWKTKTDLLKMGWSEAEARVKAAMEARESSIDFSRSGTYGQVINQIIPFFNAAVQGNDKAFRTFVRDSGGRGAAWLKATMLVTVPSVILWSINHDDDWYKEQPVWLKNNFWLFSVDGGKTIHKLPKPFEIGLIYASLAERFLDWNVDKDPKAMREWSEAVLKNVVAVNDKNPVASVGGLLGPMAGTMTEIVSNYDSFRGTPIVKGWLEEVAPREQFNANTSEFAKALGGMAPGSGLSPMMIDHFIRGTFGGLGVYAAQAASEVIMAARPELKAMKPSDKQIRTLVGAEVPDWIPVIRAFASASPSGYTRQMNDFFEIYDRGREASKTLQAFKASGAPREKFISLYRRAGADIATFKASQEVAEKLGQLSKRARFIESMPSEQMSRDEKRKQIDQLTETRNLLVVKFLERYYQIDQREIQRQIEASIPQLERTYGR